MKHKINKHIIIITTIALACLLAIFSCDTFSSDNRFATKTGELKIFSLNFRPLHNAHSLEIEKKYILPKNRISSIVLPNVNDTEFSKWNTKISEKNDINQAEVDFWNNSEHRFVRWELNSASNHGKLKIETDYENADIEKDETGYFGKHTKKDGTQEKTFLGADIKSAISKLLEKYSDVYFTAIWQMPYRVIYKQEQASDYDMYFSWYDEQLLTYSTLYGEQGQTLTFPAADASNTELTAFGLREAPTGFIFKGIFTDESFTTPASATLNYNSPTNIQTFYAKYDRKQVTLTFNAGDGEFLDDNSTQKVVTAKYGVEMNTYCPTPKTTITVGAETKTFSHWQPTLPETVPLTDTTYTAIYTGTGGGTGGGSGGGTGEPEPEPDPEPVDTTPPGQVTNVVASAKYRQIDLSWNNPTDSDFASIKIEYSKKNDASNKNTINLTSSENSYSFTDLEPNETVYSFVISTFDTSGNSANYTTEFSTITDFVRIPENTITNAMYPDSEVFIAGRTVKLNEFYISTHEVTQEEYYAVMNTAPSTFNNSPAENEIQGYRPVETVDWYDAVLYCNTRSTNEGLTPYYQITNSAGEKSTWQITCVTTANGYRLPTEAEWEYVALNFQQSSPTTYAGGNTIDNVAWVDSNSSEKTHAVTQKQPTSAGIFDMSGNVWEWCFDYYKSDLETSTPATGPTTGSYNYKVKRGGSYYDEAAESDVFYRSYSTATNSDDNIGFRVVKNVPHEPEPEPVDPTPTALGDIAYTDRTTSPSAEGVVSGKTPIGLVIEVTDGKATKIMSLTEENKAWNSDYNNFAFIPPVSNDDGSLIKDYYFEQGYNSTGARATEGNNLAALRYTEELSTATGIDWYIPSYEEGYNIFITNFTLYDSILATISGAVQIQQEDYWTSTYEDDWLDEFHEIVNEPGISYEYTTSSSLEYAFAIRCVAKFTEN